MPLGVMDNILNDMAVGFFQHGLIRPTPLHRVNKKKKLTRNNRRGVSSIKKRTSVPAPKAYADACKPCVQPRTQLPHKLKTER